MEDYINKREGDDSDNMKNIEQQTQLVVDLFSGDIILHQLLQATNLFFQIDLQSVLSLTLTSKTLLKPLSSLISQHFTFYHYHTPLIHYHPKKLKIETFYIDSFLETPHFSNVTEITFRNYKKTLDSVHTEYPFDKVIINLLSLNLLTNLTIEGHFNQPINSLIYLTKLTHLKFHYNTEFDHPTDNLLPQSLIHLAFSDDYNHPIDHLPRNLTHLSLGVSFTRPIKNQLPPNLVYLMLGAHYNRPINLLHLTKLTHLNFYFNSRFNQPIDNLLPPSLTKLTLGKDFKHSINHLPPNITHLTISKHTPLQYEQIQRIPSLLYFNNKPVRPNNSRSKKKKVT